jgi:hypothetical protein
VGDELNAIADGDNDTARYLIVKYVSTTHKHEKGKGETTIMDDIMATVDNGNYLTKKLEQEVHEYEKSEEHIARCAAIKLTTNCSDQAYSAARGLYFDLDGNPATMPSGIPVPILAPLYRVRAHISGMLVSLSFLLLFCFFLFVLFLLFFIYLFIINLIC